MALFGGKSEKAGGTSEASGRKSEAETPPLTDATQPMLGKAGNSSTSRGTQGGVTVANIGKSITIKGDLTGNEDMVIEGSVKGSIDLPNNQLTIGANGSIEAEVHAKSVIVVGHVVGNINGIERVEIQATGRVEGNVTAPKLVVAEGAQLDGIIQMAGAETLGTPRPAPATVPAGEVRKAG